MGTFDVWIEAPLLSGNLPNKENERRSFLTGLKPRPNVDTSKYNPFNPSFIKSIDNFRICPEQPMLGKSVEATVLLQKSLLDWDSNPSSCCTTDEFFNHS